MSFPWLLLNVPPGGQAESTERRLRGRPGWSNSVLKVVGLVLLTLGTFSRSVLYPGLVSSPTADIRLLPLTVALALEAISWASMPIFAWLLVQGFRHTHSIGLYALRLLALAAVCEVPYDLGNAWKPFDFGSQNPVFGMVFCLVVLWALQRLAGRKGAATMALRFLIVVAGVLYMLVLHIDQHQKIIFGGVIMLGYTLIFYYFEQRENTMIMAGAVWGILGSMFPSLGLLAIHRRNDELGYKRPGMQWLFYAIYPVMLLAFAIPVIHFG